MDLKEIVKGGTKNYLDTYLKPLKLKIKIVAITVVVSMVIFIAILGGGESSNASRMETTGGMSSANIGGLSVNGTNISKGKFIEAIENYQDDEDYKTKFAQYAEKIYDICTSKNINPVLCVAQAGNESNFGKSVPTNSPWNYWGLGVHNNSSEGIEFDSIESAINYYCDLILGYQQPESIAYEKAQIYSEYNDKITGSMNTIYDIFCVYSFLGNTHDSTIWGSINAKTYLVDYMNFPCSHELSDDTTYEEQAAYAVDYIDNRIVRQAINIFGQEIVYGRYNSDFYGGIEIYNSDGSVQEEKIEELNTYLTRDLLNTVYHNDGTNQNGPFAEWWTNTGLENFQCTWWANGRASQYLALNGTKYKSYPTKYGNGGEYYSVNMSNGYFNYGITPKRNSIISWSVPGDYGHVAYVEAVDKNGDIWISHAGGGQSWFGVSKVTKESGYAPTSGNGAWSGFIFNGFIYLDEPLDVSE